ncbi:carbamoyltransferase HypF [Synechococcus sp. RSCCF101]|nr:carbamoyltransferase HypF [Synechococcus sp. RSCCF101]
MQGVGFRPFVHRLASQLALAGEVENVAGSVRVDLQGERRALQRFLHRLGRELPGPARLERLQPRWLPPRADGPTGVHIGASAARPLGAGLIAPALVPDLAPCPACRAELADPASRRHRYPFISCSCCGPRYSIATAEPYARAHTTLAAFPLCEDCRREFHDPADRRFHAETIGCQRCGPRLRHLDRSGQPLPGDPIDGAVALLRRGGIVALQGVGGFQLLVDAGSEAAVARLRRRKRRPAKPLALLVADPGAIEPLCCIGPEERRLLHSPQAPIVLLRRRDRAGDASIAGGVAPGSPCLGVMLPASGLHLLLAEAFAGPLVATSGNRSGEQLAIDPAEALERLQQVADGFLVHNRPIARPLDDSLVQVIAGRPSLLRRARGHAPRPLELALPEQRPLIALGGDLKLAPALALEGRVWPAPHMGDAADPRALQRLGAGVRAALAQQAGAVDLACDAHPGYLSHALARQLQQQEAVARLLPVPHHLAHALAVAAEHGLPLPLAALCCDGLGFGPGAGSPLWGGELLHISRSGWRRRGQLLPFPLPGGEQAHREPPRVALGLLQVLGAVPSPAAAGRLLALPEPDVALLLRSLERGLNAPLTSSLGRLFDGVAALLQLSRRNSFEGESALALQAAAERHRPASLRSGASGCPALAAMPVRREGGRVLLDWRPWLGALLDRLAPLAAAGMAPDQPSPARDALAWAFHRDLARGLADLVEAAGPCDGAAAEPAAGRPRPVLLAGGCFQNRLLVEECQQVLTARKAVPHWAEALPAGDGGLALGQLWALAGDLAMTPVEPRSGPSASHVPGHPRSHRLDRDLAPGGGGGRRG